MKSEKYYKKISRNTGFIKDRLQDQHYILEVLANILENDLLNNYLILKGGVLSNSLINKNKRLFTDLNFDVKPFEDKKLRKEFEDQIEIELRKLKLFKDIDKKGGFLKTKFKNQYINSSDNIEYINVDFNFFNGVKPFGIMDFMLEDDIFGYNINCKAQNKFDMVGSKIIAFTRKPDKSEKLKQLFDIYNILDQNIIKKEEYNLLKKATLFNSVTLGKQRKIDQSIINHASVKNYFTKKFMHLTSTNDTYNFKEIKKKSRKYFEDIFDYTVDEEEYIKKAKDEKKSELNLILDNNNAKEAEKHEMFEVKQIEL